MNIATPTPQAFLADFREVSKIGLVSDGAVERQAGTAPDGEMRRWLCQWFEAHGMTPIVDGIGNLFGLVTFLPDLPYILIGSHLDSQPTAGRLDGAYGVIAAAHAASAVMQAVQGGLLTPKANIAVVDWFNEEGSRFAPSLMGSSVYTGNLDLETCLSTLDESGTTVRDALTEIGFLGSDIAPEASAYAEIHVEQGRLLEDHNRSIGLVTSNWAVCKFEVTVEGEQAHTGTAEMADRRDALVGAAGIVLLIRDAAVAGAGELLASVGRITSYPNVPGVVPSKVVLSLDIRAANESLLEEAVRDLTQRMPVFAATECLTVTFPTTNIRSSVQFPEAGVRLAALAAEACGLSHERIVTRAGHDAIRMNEVVPTIMSFVPSRNGASHSAAEDTTDDDLVNGAAYLTHVLAMLVSSDVDELKNV